MKTTIPKFSVIIATFNSANRIDTTLNSIMKQDIKNNIYEVIVVDDCSTDETYKIVSKFDQIKLIKNPINKGAYYSRQVGLTAAQGKIVVYTDDDVVADKNWLKELSKPYKDNNVIAVGGIIKARKIDTLAEKYLSWIGYGNPASINYSKSNNLFAKVFVYLHDMMSLCQVDKQETYPVSAIYTANASFKKKALKDIGGWNVGIRFGGDFEMSMRLLKRNPGKKILCNQKAIVYHSNPDKVIKIFQESYKRSFNRFQLYMKLNKIPPFMPFPFVYLVLIFIMEIEFKQSIFPILLSPLLLYFWWPYKAFTEKDKDLLLFPYIQLIQEGLQNFGFVLSLVKLQTFKKTTR